MSGIAIVMRSSTDVGSGSGHMDVQTVTTGDLSGTSRGYASGTYGSISTGTSGIGGVSAPATIYNLSWDNNGGSPIYSLGINSAVNSGWTTMTIGSTVLSRASATFTFGGNWSWSTSDTVSTQAFGTAGSVITVYFD